MSKNEESQSSELAAALSRMQDQALEYQRQNQKEIEEVDADFYPYLKEHRDVVQNIENSLNDLVNQEPEVLGKLFRVNRHGVNKHGGHTTLRLLEHSGNGPFGYRFRYELFAEPVSTKITRFRLFTAPGPAKIQLSNELQISHNVGLGYDSELYTKPFCGGPLGSLELPPKHKSADTWRKLHSFQVECIEKEKLLLDNDRLAQIIAVRIRESADLGW